MGCKYIKQSSWKYLCVALNNNNHLFIQTTRGRENIWCVWQPVSCGTEEATLRQASFDAECSETHQWGRWLSTTFNCSWTRIPAPYWGFPNSYQRSRWGCCRCCKSSSCILFIWSGAELEIHIETRLRYFCSKTFLCVLYFQVHFILKELVRKSVGETQVSVCLWGEWYVFNSIAMLI